MKKSTLFSTVLSATLLLSSLAFAAEVKNTRDIPVGSSGQMEMVGTIQPTILSITMPTFVPFNISSSLSGQNKVISPRIPVKNNSNVPVQVDVTYANVDLSKLRDTTWSDNGAVKDNQIAIGFKKEVEVNKNPEDLSQTRWLQANKVQDTNVMILDANQEGAMYVVGTLGNLVSESATFNVTPIFVVGKTSIN